MLYPAPLTPRAIHYTNQPHAKLLKLPVTVPAWPIAVITDYVLRFTFCRINHRFVVKTKKPYTF